MMGIDGRDLLPGERVLWQGRPEWRALARDVLWVRWIAAYFAGYLIWGAYLDRSSGLDPVETLEAGVPLFLLGAAVLGACFWFAWSYARATQYTITNERCVLRFGMALTATLSLPLRQIAVVSVAVKADGSGDIPLALKLPLKSGRTVAFLKLWPHARAWRFRRPEPMLRGVRNVAQVAALLSHAVAAVSPGRLSALPGRGREDRAAAGGLVPAAPLGWPPSRP